jgi:hypothetical protein
MPIAQNYIQVVPKHGEPSPTLEETADPAPGDHA